VGADEVDACAGRHAPGGGMGEAWCWPWWCPGGWPGGWTTARSPGGRKPCTRRASGGPWPAPGSPLTRSQGRTAGQHEAERRGPELPAAESPQAPLRIAQWDYGWGRLRLVRLSRC
jgi:hypothetical protein